MSDIKINMPLITNIPDPFLSEEVRKNYFIKQHARSIWNFLSNPESYFDNETERNTERNRIIAELHEKDTYNAYVDLLSKQGHVVKQMRRFKQNFEKDLVGDKSCFLSSVIAYALQKNPELTGSIFHMYEQWKDTADHYMEDPPCQRSEISYYLNPYQFKIYRILYGLLKGTSDNESLKQQFFLMLSNNYKELKIYADDYEPLQTDKTYANALFTPFISAWMSSYFDGVEDSRINEYLSVLYLFTKEKKYRFIEDDILFIFNLFYNIYGKPSVKRQQKTASRIRKKIEKAIRDRFEDPFMKKMIFTDVLVDIFMDERYKDIRCFCQNLFYQLSLCKQSEIDRILEEYYCFKCLKTRLTKDESAEETDFEIEFLNSLLKINDYKEHLCNEPEKITIVEKKEALRYLEEWKSFFFYAQQWLNRKHWKQIEDQSEDRKKDELLFTELEFELHKKEQEVSELKQNISETKKIEADIKGLLSTIATLKKQNKQLESRLCEAERDQKELVGLRNYIYEENLEIQEDPEDVVKMAEFLDKNVKGIIVGGHPNFHSKLQKYIPQWKKYPPRMKVPSECISGSDIIVFYTDHIDHSMYCSVIAEARRCSCRLLYIHSVNMETTIKRIYDEFEGE